MQRTDLFNTWAAVRGFGRHLSPAGAVVLSVIGFAACGEAQSGAQSGPLEVSSEPFTLIAEGNFRGANPDYTSSGTARVVRLESGAIALQLRSFRVTDGPGLNVLLSGHEDPRDATTLDSEIKIDLGNLQAVQGNQDYEIPSSVDLSTIKSIVIYCVPFRAVFANATLSASGDPAIIPGDGN